MTPETVTETLHGWMSRGVARPMPDEEFDRLARAIFAEQFEGCRPYRRYCETRGKTPASVGHWLEIPAVPTRAFKRLDLISDSQPTARVFETSGTTDSSKGRHLLSARGLDLYRQSLLPCFRHYLLPELEREGARTLLLPVVLGPAAAAVPESSLYFMIEEVCRAFFVDPPAHLLGADGLHGDELLRVLSSAESLGRPVFLFGTVLALQAACDWLGKAGESLFLAEGSRVMETGGAKGLENVTTPAELRDAIYRALGIEPASVVSEYGMTEMCSQFYEDTLRSVSSSCSLQEGDDPDKTADRLKSGPPWVRAVACDPETLEPVPAGDTGVLRFVDLANRYSLSFLQTEDLGRAPGPAPGGAGSAPFQLAGRALGAESRGCSLATEEWMRATRGSAP